MGNNNLLDMLKTFFRQNYGKSLVVKGRPGAGKTTFALEFLNHVRDETPVLYLSARFSDEPLTEQFPWLPEYSAKRVESRLPQRDFTNVISDSLGKLEKMIEEGNISTQLTSHDTGLVLNIRDLVPEIQTIYDFVDKNYNSSPIIVLDSIDALSEKYGIESATIFSVLHSDLVENSGANIIVVMEEMNNTKLEYFSDGVVSMDYQLKDDFLVRTLTVAKLRGMSTGSSPVWLYSLKEGRFLPFERDSVTYPENKLKTKVKAEERSFEVPLGSDSFSKLVEKDLDRVPLGYVVIFHRVNKSTSVDQAVNLVKNNLIRRTVLEGRGVIDATSSSYETSRVMVDTMESEVLKHYITAEKSKRSSSYVINLEGKSLVEDFPHEVIDFFMSSSSRPNVYLFSTDFLSFTYGNDFFGDLLNLINIIRMTGIIVIVADDEYYQKISHYANLTVHFRDFSGYVLLNSSKRSVFISSTKYGKDRWPEVELDEIV
ncbi:MAG TPA: gas vesicle protein GvpD P-loop domain-containing protein [Thermoplasmataceae archaeon]|nr:gas vesicle protein GvpD P-loop domain-containing protein [Thermoplasmataceae archaeon]